MPSRPQTGVATPPSSPASPSWKDHPLAVAAIAVAATIALAVLLVKEVILPTHTASLGNQVSALTSQVAALGQAKAEGVTSLEQLQSEFAEERHKNATLEQRLSEAQLSNLFAPQNPYPTGLGLVKVGQSVEEVSRAYPPESVQMNDDYWTVKDQHRLFTHITYFFDEKSKTKAISHILFQGSSQKNIGDDYLQQKLAEALGAPKQWSKANHYTWQTKTATLYKRDPRNFVLMLGAWKPNYWPDK